MKIRDYIINTYETYNRNNHAFSRLNKNEFNPDLVGNYAMNDIRSITYAFSVGFYTDYIDFIPIRIKMLKMGIDANEDFGNIEFHLYNLTSALAFATWLHTGVNDIELWKNSLKWQNELYGNPEYFKKMGHDEKEIFALSLLHYIQAKEYEKAVRFYQEVQGERLFKLNNNMSGFRIAYAYCLHLYEGKFTVEQLEKAARPFLEKHLPMLYTKGRSTEMLYWLKMVCDARKKKYTPEEVIYTFYEYIPEEEKPDFVKELLSEKQVEKKSFFSFFKW